MKRILTLSIASALMSACAVNALAGVKYTNEDGDYLKLGGRIQLQYHLTSPDEGTESDEIRFRRIRPYIEGSVHEDWKGKFQWDMGKGKIELKDAYFAYSGFDPFTIALGNHNFPFSREFLTSSKKQQLIERTFVGDHNYGTPDRQAGIHLMGEGLDGHLTYGAAVALGAVDPDNGKLDFDTTISLNEGDDWSEGPMAGGRIDIHPFGKLKMAQGDFSGDLKATIGAAAFTWQNDEDNLGSDMEENDMGGLERSIGKQDVDSVTGFEISAALRMAGFSIDAQYNSFDSELVAEGITDGLYADSETTLENYAVEGGFMVVPERLELVAGYQSQDADNYAETWNRTSVGANLFVAKHDIKYQVSYRMGENEDGEDGNDVDELFVQAQYVF